MYLNNKVVTRSDVAN